jgi:hypothetical protein
MRWPRKNDASSIEQRREAMGVNGGLVTSVDLEPFAGAAESLVGVAVIPVSAVPVEIALGTYELSDDDGDVIETGRATETVHVPLDIFVLDTTPKTAWATSLWRRAVYILERIIYARSTTFRHTLSSRQRIIAMTLAATLVSRCLPSSRWRRLHHELCILPGRFSHRSSVALMNDANKQFRRVIMTKEDWRPARRGSFEGLQVPLPARAEHLLRLNYGPNYLEPPAPASRRPIHLRNGLTAKIDGREWHCPPSLDTFPSQ